MALKFDIQGDNTQLMRQLQQVQTAVDKISGTIGSMAANGQGFGKVSKDMQSVKREAKDTAGAFDELKKAAGMTIAGIGLQQLASKIIDVRKEFQMLEVSFSTLLGSDVKGKAMFKDITEFATKTPLLEKDLASAAQTMLGFNIEAEKVMPLLKQLGDISMGDSQKMQSLVLAFSQASSTGKLMGQDLLQMINAGFNPLAEIARTTGRSMADLKDDMSKGKISIEMLEGAFASATSEGGKYNGMLEKMSQTMGGAFSNLEGAMQKLFNDMGTEMEGSIVGGVNAATSAVNSLAENLDNVREIITEMIIAFGAYKTACMVAAAATKGYTAASMLEYNWLLLCEKAQKMLNASMLTNPYVAVTMAIVALGVAVYKYATANEKASASQERLNKATGELASETAKEQREIDKAFEKLRKAKKGTDEYNDAKNNIINQYGDYLKGLGKEIESLNDVEKAYNAVTNAAIKSARARVMNKAKEGALDAYFDNTQKSRERLMNILLNNKAKFGGDKGVAGLMRQINTELEQQGKVADKTMQKITKALSTKQISDNLNTNLIFARQFINNLSNARKDLQKEYNEIDTLLGTNEEPTLKANQKKESYYAAYTKAEKAYHEAQKEVAKAKKGTAEEYTKAVEQLGAAEKEFEKYGGKIDKNGKGAQKASDQKARMTEENNKQEELVKKLSIEAQNAIAQAVIDEEKNAAKKERMQRDLDHQLALQQIAKQADEMKKATYEHNKKVYEASHKGKYENTAEGKKGISGVALTSDQQAIIDALTRSENAKYNQASNDAAKAQEKALNDYLKEYGTYQEKRKAIAADYDRQIEDASLEGEKKTLQKQKEAMLQELDFTQFKDSIRWDVVFGDMSKATDRQLKEIRRKLKDFTKSKEFAKMSADSQKAVVDALTSANNESSERNPFMETANSLAEYKKSVDDCKTAEEDYKHAMLGGSEAVIKLTKANLDAAKATKEEKYRKLADNMGKAGRAVSQSVTSIRDMFSAFQNIDSNGGALGALEGIGQELEGVSKAWQSLLNMDIAGIVSGVSDVIVGQVKTIANLGGMLDVLSSADYSGYNKMVKQYKELIEVWDELIDRKTEYIEKSYGAEAVQASEEAIGLVNREVEAWRALGKERLNSGASTGSHAIGSRQAKRTSEEDWRNIAKALNMTTAQAKDYIGTGRMTGLFDLTAEQLKSLQENAPEFWAKMDGDVKEYLESIIKSAKTIEQINDTTKQQLTNTSFDSLRESFVSTLSDMESSSADFADNFSNMLFNAVLNQQVGKLLDKELQEYYDMFADYMEGKRTASELQQKWQAIVNQGTEIRNNVASATGYGTSTSQKATSKEIKSITEDTANQLVGRITTMQIAVEANKSNLSEIAKQVAMSVASLQGIGSLQTATSSMLQSIQLGMQSANEYLFDIAKASKGMYSDFANKLDKIVKNTDKL